MNYADKDTIEWVETLTVSTVTLKRDVVFNWYLQAYMLDSDVKHLIKFLESQGEATLSAVIAAAQQFVREMQLLMMM